MPDRLQQAITVLQTRFGSAAPRPAAPPCPARSSGIPELDALTGIGGWPVGRLSLLAGPRGSGKRTLAQRSIAAASREGPVAYVDIPTGVNGGAKKKIFQELYEEIHEAWPIPDTRVLIREWPNQAVSQDGRIENVPMRPICTLAVPPGLEHDAKQRLVRQISNTIGEACGREVQEIRLPSGTKIYNNWVLTFFWELPLDKVALGDLIATENPLVLENLPPQ